MLVGEPIDFRTQKFSGFLGQVPTHCLGDRQVAVGNFVLSKRKVNQPEPLVDQSPLLKPSIRAVLLAVQRTTLQELVDSLQERGAALQGLGAQLTADLVDFQGIQRLGDTRQEFCIGFQRQADFPFRQCLAVFLQCPQDTSGRGLFRFSSTERSAWAAALPSSPLRR